MPHSGCPYLSCRPCHEVRPGVWPLFSNLSIHHLDQRRHDRNINLWRVKINDTMKGSKGRFGRNHDRFGVEPDHSFSLYREGRGRRCDLHHSKCGVRCLLICVGFVYNLQPLTVDIRIPIGTGRSGISHIIRTICQGLFRGSSHRYCYRKYPKSHSLRNILT